MSDFISGMDLIRERSLHDFELIPLVARVKAYNGLGIPIDNPIQALISLTRIEHENEIAGNEVRKRLSKEHIENWKLEIVSIKNGTSDKLRDFLNERVGRSLISEDEWKKRQIANLERLICENEIYLGSNPDDIHLTRIDELIHIEEFLAGGITQPSWNDFVSFFTKIKLTALIEDLKGCLFKREELNNSKPDEHKLQKDQDIQATLDSITISLNANGEIIIKKDTSNLPWRAEHFKFGNKEWDIFSRILNNDGYCIDIKMLPNGSIDALRKRLDQVNKKLIEFFKNNYRIQFPDKFKLIDHPSDKPRSFFKLIINSSSSNRIKLNLSDFITQKENLLKRLSLTSDYTYAKEIRDSISELVVHALSDKLIDKSEASKIYQDIEDADITDKD